MDDILQSTRRYEDWLRRQLDGDLVETDIERKHAKMAGDGAFPFLRATYWRWAETVLTICGAAGDAPAVLAVGDIHLENFGTWRDADGRLAWGVNDFDEAAEMPYVLDLIRLATSAIIAATDARAAPALCRAVLNGYRQGLSAPRPLILDRDLAWLRELVAVSEKQRAKFWKKVANAEEERAPAPYRRALAAAMPEPGLRLRTARRTAGLGSLGRPRWIAIADWRGAPIVREAKALVPSSWQRANGGRGKLQCADIAGGRYRAIDPWFRVEGGLATRRLSPNNRKIEADDGVAPLLAPQMLEAMGLDLASVHLGTGTGKSAAAIRRDLEGRKSGWLLAAARRMAAAVKQDHAQWKAAQSRSG
jgi:Uncharacterized protein conserved in bacteria (DUF2252)